MRLEIRRLAVLGRVDDWMETQRFFQNTGMLRTSVWGVVMLACSFYEYLSSYLPMTCAFSRMYLILK